MRFKGILSKFAIVLPLTLFAVLIWYVAQPQMVVEREPTRVEKTGYALNFYARALQLFWKDLGRYPTREYGLKELSENIEGTEGWYGPYVVPLTRLADGWGNKLVFHNPAICLRSVDVDLYSVGENGIDECMSGDDVGASVEFLTN